MCNINSHDSIVKINTKLGGGGKTYCRGVQSAGHGPCVALETTLGGPWSEIKNSLYLDLPVQEVNTDLKTMLGCSLSKKINKIQTN